MDLFDLCAKITLDTDGYEKGLDDAGKKSAGFASSLKGKPCISRQSWSRCYCGGIGCSCDGDKGCC